MRSDADLATSAGRPALTVLSRLQDERRLTAVWQAKPSSSSRTDLDTARRTTDTAVKDFHQQSQSEWESAGAAVQDRAEGLNDALDELPRQRDAIDKRAVSGAQAFKYYTDTAADSTNLFSAVTRTDDGRLAHGVAAVTSVVRSSEMLSREDALLSGAAVSGSMAANARRDFTEYVATQREIRAAIETQDLPQAEARNYQLTASSPQWASVASIEDAVSTGTTGLPKGTGKWRGAADPVGRSLRQLASGSLESVADSGSARATGLLLLTALSTVVAIGALGATIVLARRTARSLFGRVAGLRVAIDDLTDTRLPQMVQQIKQGEQVSPAEHAPDRDYGTDELGQLGAAFHRLRQTVAVTMVRQAQGREGTKKVFVNLARRTQVLIHRQISMLDDLERKHEDPELLEDLFTVDHLATRVRRHAENLVILGGSLPARRWSEAVPVVNVLRSALSETEAYTRVKVLPVPRLSLVGQAVADVVHLVAELIENGTSFSPPETQVSIGAEKVTKGLVLEVEDRGLGMPEEEYERINEVLADPPELDMMMLGEDPRLGLFVVGRLAGRHGIEVSLRKSPYGGTRAIVLLPGALLEENTSPLGIPGLLLGSSSETTDETVSDGPAIITHPQPDEHSGRPSLGGAGLLPSTPGHAEEGVPAPAAEILSAADPWALSPGDTDTETVHARPSEDEAPREDPSPSGDSTRPRVLPKRVRQASIADQLREAAGPPVPEQEDDDEPGASSADRSVTVMAAIQREARRARETESAEPAEPAGDELSGRQDPQAAETPGQGTGTGDSVMKDQR